MSLWHLLLLVIIILLLFGPSRLPQMGKSIGEAIRGFKKGLNEDPEIDVTNQARHEQIREGEGQGTTKTQSKDRQNV